MKELIEQDEDFKEVYRATQANLLTLSLTIVAVSALLISFIIFFE